MKISDYLTITSRPQIIELSDDFILDGLAYSKYTLQSENQLNFFFLDTNINNDYRYMPIDNLCCDVNDYSIHRILKDDEDSNICYILYRIVSTDYVAKIEKQKDESYKLLSTIKISNTNSKNDNTYYYTRRGLEFICQTVNNILIYDNNCIRNIDKQLSKLSTYELREPVYVESVSNDSVTFIDIIYSQRCIYNCLTNSLSLDWTDIDTNETTFSFLFSFNEGENIFPFISNSYFSKSFKYYNNIRCNDYNYENYRYTTPSSPYNVYYSKIKQPSSFFNNQSVTIPGYHRYTYAYQYNNGNTYVQYWRNTGYGLQSDWYDGIQIIHTNIQKQFTIYNQDLTKEYTITTEDTNGFNKFFIEKFNNNLLIINNTNNISNIYLFDQNINLLAQTTLSNPFAICDKYNENSFCLLDSSNAFYVFKLNMNNSIEQVYYISDINAFSVNNGNVWMFNNQKFEIITPGTVENINADFEQENYEYEGENISSYITIYARNFLGQNIKTKVILTLSGPCLFNNGTNSCVEYTDEIDINIPIIITDAGKCSCEIEEY